MGVTTTQTNKPFNPRGNDQSPKGFNRAKLYSGKALSFDGVNDSVSVPTNSAFNFGTDNFTLSAHLKITAGGSFSQIFGTKGGSAPNSGYSLYYQYSSGKFLFSNANGSSSSEIFTADSFSEYVGQWIHIAAIRDSSDSKNGLLYINGVKAELASAMTIIDGDNTNPFTIGVATGPNHYGKQQMSGVKVFNTALTAAQVADLYNNPEKVVPTGVDNTALKLWLPMQEGAGTTAYDGSGNGNHGTISGATWAHGVGAPVSQTAVIDWNKGTNLLGFSEQLQRTGVYTQDTITVTSNTDVAPNGLTQAATLTDSSTSAYAKIQANPTTTGGTSYYAGIYVKKATSAVSHYCGFQFDTDSQYIIFDNYNGTYVSTSGGGGSYNSVEIEDVNSDWWRILVNVAANASSERFAIWPAISSNGTSISATATGSNVFWGASVSTSKPYLTTPTNGVQTSDVLLPQGLTTGRDITGVNLFENVRKQGALNLDGNSWGKVHPNNSFAFGTGAFSLEAWAKLEYVNTGSYANEIIALNDSDDFAIKTISTGTSFSVGSGVSISHTITLDNSWAHIVGVRNADGSMQLYINGVEEESNAAGSSTASVPVTNPVRLGTDTNEASRTYKDQIAQPRIYNRALTAAEVLQNYNSGKNTYK